MRDGAGGGFVGVVSSRSLGKRGAPAVSGGRVGGPGGGGGCRTALEGLERGERSYKV